MGVTTSIFPSDEVAVVSEGPGPRGGLGGAFGRTRMRGYDRVIEIDLSSLEPLVACPHSPGNVVKLSPWQALPVDQVCIGSCTNSSYQDLMTAAARAEGADRSIPASAWALRPVRGRCCRCLRTTGRSHDLIGRGRVSWRPPAASASGTTSRPRAAACRSARRTAISRAARGTKDAQVYLVSPEAAAVAAVTGRLTDPRRLGMDYPKIRRAGRVSHRRQHVHLPRRRNGAKLRSSAARTSASRRGTSSMAPDLDGSVAIKVGDKITTDHIMPAGARLKYRSNVPKYCPSTFSRTSTRASPARCLENKAKGLHNVIVAGESTARAPAASTRPCAPCTWASRR